MSNSKVYLLGAGGFAREALDIYTDLNRAGDVLGFVEQNSKRDGGILNGKKIFDEKILDNVPSGVKLIGAIGSSKRRVWIERLEQQGFKFDTVIHPSVIKSKWVKFGDGCIICAGNIFTCNIDIGNHTIVNLGCTIGHDVKMGSFITVSPRSNISGNVTIEDEVWVGSGSTIIEKISIGKGSYIGAGACVTKDIPAKTLAVSPQRDLQYCRIREGVPAIPKKKVDRVD